MTISRLLERARNDVLRTIVCGRHHGMGEDAAMVAGLESWQSPYAVGFERDDVETYISAFGSLMDLHWDIRNKISDIAKHSGPRAYSSSSVSLNRKVVESLAATLEMTVAVVDALGRTAVHWSATVAAIHHSRRTKDVKIGLEFAEDLADIAGLSDTKDRLAELMRFVEANGNDPDTILNHVMQWEEKDAILKGVKHAFSIDINSENPLFDLAGME